MQSIIYVPLPGTQENRERLTAKYPWSHRRDELRPSVHTHRASPHVYAEYSDKAYRYTDTLIALHT